MENLEVLQRVAKDGSDVVFESLNALVRAAEPSQKPVFGRKSRAELIREFEEDEAARKIQGFIRQQLAKQSVRDRRENQSADESVRREREAAENDRVPPPLTCLRLIALSSDSPARMRQPDLSHKSSDSSPNAAGATLLSSNAALLSVDHSTVSTATKSPTAVERYGLLPPLRVDGSRMPLLDPPVVGRDSEAVGFDAIEGTANEPPVGVFERIDRAEAAARKAHSTGPPSGYVTKPLGKREVKPLRRLLPALEDPGTASATHNAAQSATTSSGAAENQGTAGESSTDGEASSSTEDELLALKLRRDRVLGKLGGGKSQMILREEEEERRRLQREKELRERIDPSLSIEAQMSIKTHRDNERYLERLAAVEEKDEELVALLQRKRGLMQRVGHKGQQ